MLVCTVLGIIYLVVYVSAVFALVALLIVNTLYLGVLALLTSISVSIFTSFFVTLRCIIIIALIHHLKIGVFTLAAISNILTRHQI